MLSKILSLSNRLQSETRMRINDQTLLQSLASNPIQMAISLNANANSTGPA